MSKTLTLVRGNAARIGIRMYTTSDGQQVVDDVSLCETFEVWYVMRDVYTLKAQAWRSHDNADTLIATLEGYELDAGTYDIEVKGLRNGKHARTYRAGVLKIANETRDAVHVYADDPSAQVYLADKEEVWGTSGYELWVREQPEGADTSVAAYLEQLGMGLFKYEDNPEYIAAWVDGMRRLLMAIRREDGHVVFGAGIPPQIKETIDQLGYYVENPEWLRVLLDGEKRILFGIKRDGSVEWYVGVPTAIKEYVAQQLAGRANTSYKRVDVTEDMTAREQPEAGMQVDVLYVNTTGETRTVTIPNGTYKTPTGETIRVVVPAGGYGEASFLNIDGVTYVRGA